MVVIAQVIINNRDNDHSGDQSGSDRSGYRRSRDKDHSTDHK